MLDPQHDQKTRVVRTILGPFWLDFISYNHGLKEKLVPKWGPDFGSYPPKPGTTESSEYRSQCRYLLGKPGSNMSSYGFASFNSLLHDRNAQHEHVIRLAHLKAFGKFTDRILHAEACGLGRDHFFCAD